MTTITAITMMMIRMALMGTVIIHAAETESCPPRGSSEWVHWHYEFSRVLVQYTILIFLVYGSFYVVFTWATKPAAKPVAGDASEQPL